MHSNPFPTAWPWPQLHRTEQFREVSALTIASKDRVRAVILPCPAHYWPAVHRSEPPAPVPSDGLFMPDASHLQRRGAAAMSFQNQYRPAGAIDLDALPILQALRCPAGADHRWYAVLPRDHRRMAQNATAVGDQTTHGSEQ
jgi:hypothetical protein